MKKIYLSLLFVIASVCALAQTNPGTGIFAPGKYYSFLGVATTAAHRQTDWSGCLATTVGTYSLSRTSFLSADLLGGFSFTHNAADMGVDVAYNFAGGHVGSVQVGYEFGFVALTAKGVKAGYGLLLGGWAKF